MFVHYSGFELRVLPASLYEIFKFSLSVCVCVQFPRQLYIGRHTWNMNCFRHSDVYIPVNCLCFTSNWKCSFYYVNTSYPMDNCFTDRRDQSRQTPEKDVLYILPAGPVTECAFARWRIVLHFLFTS